MIYTYAFLKTPEQPLELPEGISGPVALVCAGLLSALVEPNLVWDALQETDDRLLQAVLAHDRVLCVLFQQMPLLPLRFGTRFTSLEDLKSHLESYLDLYLKKLMEVANRAEYTLKLIPPQPVEEPTISAAAQGRAYFLAKKQRIQSQAERQQRQMVELEEVLEAIVAAFPKSKISEVQSEQKTQQVYLLLTQEEYAQIEAFLQTWQELASQWQLVLGEPLPPYHFV
ncbi:hypothetical protein BST81_04620 [Leptolyngbya sp. 'hensonii']|uniref:GvpL/GvpF family gas vesicle protein n=1 Tax=Leptolyngbya sp. 'hensonii' TaxID=1922337 RepID=UPI00094FE0D2|nr:GvpL/GvpF family gas vesicle protein [Leptolyngbya sp. 'hensonii']OLP19559.1 hypothetical protein BST81_04620 [Leptolyngbya sp. 'hensonii']